MRDEILDQLRLQEAALEDRLQQTRKRIRERTETNAQLLGETDFVADILTEGFVLKRFWNYTGRAKYNAIVELLAENPDADLETIAQLMVKHGVPLGRTRQLANARKSITEYIRHGRLKSSGGKLSPSSGNATAAR